MRHGGGLPVCLDGYKMTPASRASHKRIDAGLWRLVEPHLTLVEDTVKVNSHISQEQAAGQLWQWNGVADKLVNIAASQGWNRGVVGV